MTRSTRTSSRTTRDLRSRRAERTEANAAAMASASGYSTVKTVAPGVAGGPITLNNNRTPNDVYDRVPKLPCPSCGNVIALSLDDLLHQAGITCPHCLLTLTMDRASSHEAITHMRQFFVAMKDIKAG